MKKLTPELLADLRAIGEMTSDGTGWAKIEGDILLDEIDHLQSRPPVKIIASMAPALDGTLYGPPYNPDASEQSDLFKVEEK